MQTCQQPENGTAQTEIEKRSCCRGGGGNGISGTGNERPERGRREDGMGRDARHVQPKRSSRHEKQDTSKDKQYAKVEPVRTGKHGEVGIYGEAYDEEECREQTGRPRNLSGKGDTAEGWQGAKAKSRKRSPS